MENYDLTLNHFDNIKYNSLPKPNFEIENANIGVEQNKITINVTSLIIYPKLYSIYNFKTLTAFLMYADDQLLLNYPIHLKFNTGLNRLGLYHSDIPLILNNIVLILNFTDYTPLILGVKWIC